jgi:hypothetical protein
MTAADASAFIVNARRFNGYAGFPVAHDARRWSRKVCAC